MSLLLLPTYSPELNPVERWFQEFRCALANRVFETIGSPQDALTQFAKFNRLLLVDGGHRHVVPSMISIGIFTDLPRRREAVEKVTADCAGVALRRSVA